MKEYNLYNLCRVHYANSMNQGHNAEISITFRSELTGKIGVSAAVCYDRKQEHMLATDYGALGLGGETRVQLGE